MATAGSDLAQTTTTGDHDYEVSFIRKWWQDTGKRKRVVIVTAGKSGVGKSTLINHFLQLEGDQAIKTRLQPGSVTKTVDYFDHEINGVQVRVVDMPGLHASDQEDGEDTGLVAELNALTKGKADVLFYCMSLVSRADKIDWENIDTLTKAFGKEIWEHAIFVFTWADIALQTGSNLEELVEEFVKTIHGHLVEKRKVGVTIRSIYSFKGDTESDDSELNTFDGIVGIPASIKPGIPPEWKLTLLYQVIRKCRKRNIPAFLQLKYISWDDIKQTSIAGAAGGVGGAIAGTATGAVVGAIIGGLLTSPIGGVGAVPTAAGGAALGAWIGTIGGAGSISVASVLVRVAFIVRSRYKVEKRARKKIREMIEKEKKEATDTRQ